MNVSANKLRIGVSPSALRHVGQMCDASPRSLCRWARRHAAQMMCPFVHCVTRTGGACMNVNRLVRVWAVCATGAAHAATWFTVLSGSSRHTVHIRWSR